jgi:periplasmic iron binding protein
VSIEADIKGIKGNNNGFGEGEWIPYLDVGYTISKAGSSYKKSGTLYPMVASDGPHYGDNIKMDGPGKYHVVYTIKPGAHNFLRHTDKETGVGAWWAPFTVEYDFAYTGTGAKSGY